MTAGPGSSATGQLRVGVLGAGVIATADYGVLPNMRHIAGKARVTAIADTVPGRAQAVAERFGIPQAFGSLADMLATADIDAVANLTPIPVHAELSLQILAARRHLVTEKPLPGSTSGVLGPARRVTALSGSRSGSGARWTRRYDGLRIDVTADDNTAMLLDFGDSCFGLADGTFNMHATRAPRLEVFGREGTLVMHYNTNETGPNPPVELYQAATPGPHGRRGGWAELDLGHLDRGQQHVDRVRRALLIEHLADCVREGREPELGLARARHVLEIMIKAMESARTGAAVDLDTSFAVTPA